MAAIICVRTDQEIKKEVLNVEFHRRFSSTDATLSERLNNFKQRGAIFDPELWYKKAVGLLNGDYTFSEAYERTGRILNISVVPDEPHAPSKLLNYITAPDVTIASAGKLSNLYLTYLHLVLASSAIPFILPPIELHYKDPVTKKILPYHTIGKRWRDGSILTDIPEKSLNLHFNTSYTIVSQSNPHILVFFYERDGSAGCPPPHRYGKGAVLLSLYRNQLIFRLSRRFPCNSVHSVLETRSCQVDSSHKRSTPASALLVRLIDGFPSEIRRQRYNHPSRPMERIFANHQRSYL